MGLYRSVVRPVAFAFPPEAAHRIFGTALRMPLPWGTSGGAGDLPQHPVDLAGLALRNPIGLAAGFDKNGLELRGLSRLGFGYLVVGTVTREPRDGNAKPRIVRRPDRASLVNAMGLPNRGVEALAGRLARRRRGPATSVLASIADEAREDVLASYDLLAPVVDGFELNASCPNVSWGRDTDDEEHLRDLVTRLVERRTAPGRPLFVKLPPFETAAEREAVLALARVAQDAGADGLTCSNSRPVAEPRLSVGKGGLSGGELTAGTPRIVAEVHRATGGTLPINACGGVSSAADARTCLEAGAATVQLYTGIVYAGPRVVRDIVRGLPTPPETAEAPAPDELDAPSEAPGPG